MAQNRPRYVSTFRAPTEYELEVERARRQKALAEALAQQEYQPMEGAAAPIPRAAPLVKALQGYLTARAGRQAEEAEKAAEKAGRVEIADYIRSFEPEQRTVGVGDIAAMEATASQIDPQGRVSYNPPSAVAAPNQRLMPAMTATGEPDFSQPMQMQVGGPLSMAQRRARALEGLESTNPLVQQFAASQYEATTPKRTELKVGDIDPDKFTPQSVRAAMQAGDYGLLVPVAGAPAAVTPVTIRRGGRDVVIDARTQEVLGDAPVTPRDEPLMSIIGPDGKPILARRSQAEGKQPFFATMGTGTQATGDSAVDRRKYRENRQSLQNAMDALTGFATQLKNTPREESITGDKAGRLSASYKLALGAVRELQNTGVLNPGELPFIEDTLRDPQSMKQLLNPAARETITGQLETIGDLLNRRAQRNDEMFGYDVKPLSGAEMIRRKQTRSKF